MGIADKAKNVAQDLAGKAKEVAGEVTNDDKLKAEFRQLRDERKLTGVAFLDAL